jgi:alanine-glyoxylate transaminase / serine-glyoxylate transaminase / serine-pyruvate transaminase
VGRHFLQIPGPTNVPDRVLRAIDAPTIDHRGPAFARLGREVLDGRQEVFRTDGPVVIYPSSGTGAWEAALVNTLSPGERVLAYETATSPRCHGRRQRRAVAAPVRGGRPAAAGRRPALRIQ